MNDCRSRRLLPGILCLLTTSAALARSQGAERPPNIVFIVSDDQGYNDLGVLNGEVISPNLDRLCPRRCATDKLLRRLARLHSLARRAF